MAGLVDSKRDERRMTEEYGAAKVIDGIAVNEK